MRRYIDSLVGAVIKRLVATLLVGVSIHSRNEYVYVIVIIIIIIISAQRRPLLGIGFPQVSPQLPVPCLSHPAGSRDFHQVVGPPCIGPTHEYMHGLHIVVQGLAV